jgi:hypothetical protein
MAPLVDAHKKGELFTWNKDHFKVSDPISRGVMGIASESDATLGLLQGLADAPDIYILPSPDKYEHSCNQSDRNSDLILLDPTNETAHGIQVKTSTRGIAKHREYDPAFVTVIDNEQDLKNLIYLRQPGRSDSSPVAMPGLYAAHYLAQQKGLHRHATPAVMHHRATPGQQNATHNTDSTPLTLYPACMTRMAHAASVRAKPNQYRLSCHCIRRQPPQWVRVHR